MAAHRKAIVSAILCCLCFFRVSGAEYPARIVSLVPNITEALFAIGAGDRVVGVSSFDEYPPDVRRITRVGGLLDPNLERIFALKPDLAVVYGSQLDLQRQLEGAGIATYSYRHGGIGDVTRVMRDLGRRLGLEASAERAARDIEGRLDAVRRRVASKPHPKVLLVFGRERGTLRSIHASGGRGFLHDLLRIAGGENVLADIKRESVQASTELILTRAPDVILDIYGADVLSEAEAAREAALWNALPGVPAVRDGRVHVLSGQELVVPGPRIAGAAERFAGALHGLRP